MAAARRYVDSAWERACDARVLSDRAGVRAAKAQMRADAAAARASVVCHKLTPPDDV